MIIKALHSLLLTDAPLVALLAKYQFTTGIDAPAIFSSYRAPDNATNPMLVLSQPDADDKFGCRDKRGGNIQVDARVYDDKEWSTDRIRAIALRVWEVINRANLQPHLAGYEDVGCYADLPEQSVDISGFPVYLVRVRVRVMEL